LGLPGKDAGQIHILPQVGDKEDLYGRPNPVKLNAEAIPAPTRSGVVENIESR
jgi:hypothetical protein